MFDSRFGFLFSLFDAYNYSHTILSLSHCIVSLPNGIVSKHFLRKSSKTILTHFLTLFVATIQFYFDLRNFFLVTNFN